MSREIELAWAAGFFDGEGSFSAQKAKNGNYYPQACIGQVDREVLDRFAAAVGMGKVYGPYDPGSRLGTKDWWQYHVHSYPNVLNLLEMLRPYLGRIKTAQAEACLRMSDNNIDRRRALSFDQIESIFTMLDNGLRGFEIANKLGVSQKIVSYYKRNPGPARRAGIHRAHETKLLDEEVVDIESEEAVA